MLVIIGLIVGGVLVGQSLISAAGVRATITQIDTFNSSVNTFREKYGALPGDIPANLATQFGFTPRGQYAGEGDGNGIIEGVWQNAASSNYGNQEVTGETPMVWVDLTTANGLNVNLIPGAFDTASPYTLPGSSVTGSAIAQYLPSAKLGRGNYFYVTSSLGVNYFGLSAVTSMQPSPNMVSSPALTVQEAYGIDKKIDDGYPQTGNVLAWYLNNVITWAGTIGTGATLGGPTTCYDNGNSAGATQQYSVAQNNGTGVNCALGIRFQ